MKLQPRILSIIVICLAAFCSFLTIGRHDLSEWDEARNGSNAYEMLHTGDYINYYYNGELDTWSAKPPLFIWMIALSYRLFGFNEFALRFPAAVSTVLYFWIFFKTVSRYEGHITAFLCCLLLLSCKAVCWDHIGITGDFDAPLILLLMCSVYCFAQYVDYGRKTAACFAAVFTALAFYVKGSAGLVYLPGFILYTVFRNKFRTIIKDGYFYLSLLIFLVLAGSWPVLVALYGKTPEMSFYGSRNSVETLLVHDTFRRLTDSHFGEQSMPNRWYFFTTVDARLNVWNYFLYVSVLAGLWKLHKNRKRLYVYINKEENRTVLLSLCLIIPLSLVLSFAANKHDWYLAPAFGFLAILMIKGIVFLINRWRPLTWLFAGLFCFLFIRHCAALFRKPDDLHTFFQKSKTVNRAPAVVLTQPLRQNIFLYLQWLDKKMIRTDIHSISAHKKALIVADTDRIPASLADRIMPLRYYGEYCIGTIR